MDAMTGAYSNAEQGAKNRAGHKVVMAQHRKKDIGSSLVLVIGAWTANAPGLQGRRIS